VTGINTRFQSLFGDLTIIQLSAIISHHSKEYVMAKFARYENTEDSHAKFWQITSIGPDSIKAEWGKISKAPQGEKVYTLAEVQKLILEKGKKGYKLVDSK